MTDSQEELWEIIHTLDERVAELERLLAIGREKIAELNTENSGWLETYRQQQSQIYELKAAISRLEIRIRSQQGES